MHQRILLLGPTGVDKAIVAQRLREHVLGAPRWAAQAENAQSWRYVSFEDDFLKSAAAPWRSWVGFLNNPLPTQNMFWKLAWQAFAATLDQRTTILALHSVFASGVYGIRSACDLDMIARDFAPTIVVTLVDDVFNIWKRTEARADGYDIRGRPTIEQLLSSRRAEQLMGDMVAIKASSVISPVPHILFSVGNSLDALANLLVNRARVTYLSFPISAPRKLMERGDHSLERVINRAHQLAQREMVADGTRCFISPLSIDELPFAKRAERARNEKFKFSASDRWSIPALWGEGQSCALQSGEQFEFARKDVLRAAAIIDADVGWRDRRLVQQADSLAIICPKHPSENRITRGVESEIYAAGGLGISCSVWQDPRWDDQGFVRSELASEAGTMGANPDRIAVRIVESLEDVIHSS